MSASRMTGPSIGRRWVSFVAACAVALAPVGCKKDEKTADKGVDAETPGTPEAKESAEQTPAPPQEQPPVAAVDPSGFTEPAVSYPSALNDLLDIVPEDEASFVVVRDPGGMLELLGLYAADQVEGLAPLAKQADAEFGTALEESAKLYAGIAGEIAKGVINLDKGVVVLQGGDTVVYGADEPDALPTLLKKFGAETYPEHCVALEAVPGYAACSRDEPRAAELAPGKQSAQLRKSLEASLAGFDVERGNVVGRIHDGAKPPVDFAVATPAGSIHAAVGLGELAGAGAMYLGKGAPKALGLADPGAAFVWAKLDPSALNSELAAAGPPVSTVGKTFDGELYFGGLTGAVPIAALVGVTDPHPAAGLVSLASTMIDMVPKQLPDGTKVKISVDEVQAGGKAVSALHAVLSGTERVERLIEMGFEAEAFAFAAGDYAAAAMGTGRSVVETVATFEGAGVDRARLERIPPGLARALASGEAAWALYVPLDGLQAPQLQKHLSEGVAMMPARERGGLPPERFANAMLSLVAPISSIGAWMTHPERERVVHLTVSGFVDGDTQKGEAAREAVAEVTAGGDRKTIYGALAAAHDDPRFVARTGEDEAALSAALTGVIIISLMTAVAGAIRSGERRAAIGPPRGRGPVPSSPPR